MLFSTVIVGLRAARMPQEQRGGQIIGMIGLSVATIGSFYIAYTYFSR